MYLTCISFRIETLTISGVFTIVAKLVKDSGVESKFVLYFFNTRKVTKKQKKYTFIEI